LDAAGLGSCLKTDTGINAVETCSYAIRMSVNIKMDVTETGCDDGRWTELAWDHVQ
jgi:hypothetical protein